MADLQIIRDFAATPERLFKMISTQAGLLQWWGHEATTLPEHDLDFSRLGPWFSVMQNGEGKRYKVSGQVTHVDAPKSLGFTWAWHDEADRRGAESHVTFAVEALAGGGARLVLDHRDLPAGEQADNHAAGWASTLRRLSALLG